MSLNPKSLTENMKGVSSNKEIVLSEPDGSSFTSTICISLLRLFETPCAVSTTVNSIVLCASDGLSLVFSYVTDWSAA